MSSPDNIVSDAFYSQINYGFSDKLKFIAGLRVEKLHKYNVEIKSAMFTPLEKTKGGEYSNDNYKFIPRLAAIYIPNNNHTIKIMYGKAIKHPSLMQNITQINSDYPTLYPAFIETFELNYIFSPTTKFFTNISIYMNNLEDLIVKRNIYNPNDKTWKLHSTNSGKMSTKGIELCIKTIPLNNLNLNLNFSYQNTKNLEQGFEEIIPGYSPEFLGYFKADYTFKKFSFALIGRYIGKMETLWDNTKISVNSENVKGRIGKTIEPQYNIDFNLRIDNIFNKGFFVNLHIYNVLNKGLRFPVTTGNSWAELGTLDYGRSFSIGVGIIF
jgi:outer membrane receptor protein involved in Fe transport